MIQRIQSIFFLLAAAAAFSLFAFPFASTEQAVNNSALFSDGIYNIQDHIALLIMFCLAGGLSFVTIFLFKNRKLQLNIGRFAFIANLLGLILAVVFFFHDKEKVMSTPIDDGIGIFLPIVSFVFLLLAIHFITKDEKLVKSMDRLR